MGDSRQELITRVEARRLLAVRTAEPKAAALFEALEAWAVDSGNAELQSAAVAAAGDMPHIGGEKHRYLKRWARTAGDVSLVLPARKAAEVCSYLIALEHVAPT